MRTARDSHGRGPLPSGVAARHAGSGGPEPPTPEIWKTAGMRAEGSIAGARTERCRVQYPPAATTLAEPDTSLTVDPMLTVVPPLGGPAEQSLATCSTAARAARSVTLAQSCKALARMNAPTA